MSAWKYNRMYANQVATPVNKIVDPALPARIDVILATAPITDWERSFCESIKAGYEKYKSLTSGQHDTFIKIEQRHDATAIAAREEWIKNFTPEMMANWQLLIAYYANTPYYKGAVERWNKDKNYIPSAGQYESICNNIYAQRMLKQVGIAPRFSVGHLCVVHLYSKYCLATVIEVKNVSGPQKGSRLYTVANVGSAELYDVQEKNLLLCREGLLKKLEAQPAPI